METDKPSWIGEEQARIDTEKQKSMQEQGMLPYWTAPEGMTRIQILTAQPPEDSKFEGKKQLHIIVKGVESLWTINTKSPLWRDVIAKLNEGKTTFDVMRVGTKREDTKYKLMDIAA